MPVLETFRVGTDRLVCHDWHAGTHTVVVGPAQTGSGLQSSSIRRVLEILEGRGVTRVLTTVLEDPAVEPFVDVGFELETRVCLLHHDLAAFPTGRGRRPRRGRPGRDLVDAARLDHRAFPAHEEMDEHGLRAAIAATPARRFRLMDRPFRDQESDSPPAAFAISGYAGRVGYLQRLAVDPAFRRSGLATALVVDGLRWFRRRRALGALVTTAADNEAARTLYADLGFTPSSRRLAVWSRPCDLLR